ncbi:hypothetical protein WJX73_007496 [Symbiochloris irregularis]|uniref:Radical SAM core domain-containing protein n=1 Tax=Symbiochloris irregularis TaxID=706552 RepID=A0AAW1NQN2_9CHLO
MSRGALHADPVDLAAVPKHTLPKHLAEAALLGRSIPELEVLAKETGQPAYRGKQLYDGLLKGALTLEAISNIPKAWKEELREAGYSTGRAVVHRQDVAPDGTRKLLLRLADGRLVETVGIPANEKGQNRLTVCVSSQVGCAMACSFCATGLAGFARNLAPHEIVDQVMAIGEAFGGQRPSHIVFMGMGEPCLNLKNVLKAHASLNTDLGIGARRMTISTVGIPNSIAQLAQHNLQATLALSLHAPTQSLREQIIPSAKHYPLDAIMRDCNAYFQSTGRRVTIEYTLLAGVNDSVEQAQALVKLLQRHKMRSHINLIPWNPVEARSQPVSSKSAAP